MTDKTLQKKQAIGIDILMRRHSRSPQVGTFQKNMDARPKTSGMTDKATPKYKPLSIGMLSAVIPAEAGIHVSKHRMPG
jgi:hypothetical protein